MPFVNRNNTFVNWSLHHIRFKAQMSLQTDASSSHVAGILQQKIGDDWQPIACSSKSLSPAEQTYPTFDRELPAAFRTCERFCYYTEGKHVTLLTDNRPLTGPYTKSGDRIPR